MLQEQLTCHSIFWHWKTGRINPAQRDAVREVVLRNLVGTEIIADASDLITIQVLLNLPELPVNTAVRRMFLISNAMHKDAMTSLAKMSRISLGLLNDSVEAFLRRDYYSPDSIVDKTEGIRSLENEIIFFLDKENTSSSTQHESTNVYIKLILEDIQRTAEHASDIAEAAMNETVSEVIEKIPSREIKVVAQ